MDQTWVRRKTRSALNHRQPASTRSGWRHWLTGGALAIGLVVIPGKLPAAHAAPVAVDYRYFMDVVSPRTSICLGEIVHYTVTVNRTPASGDFDPKPIIGVKVEAYVDDPSIGKFSGAKKAGTAAGQTGFNLDNPASVEFEFTAGKKPGKTTLQFQGKVNGVAIQAGYVSFPVGIEVKVCSYRITTVTRFPPNSKDNPDIAYPPIVVIMKKAIVKADADGQFTGTGTANWVGSTFVSGCRVKQRFGDPSPVAISGKLFEDQLTLEFRYQPVGGAAIETCGPATVAGPLANYLLDTLDVTIDPAGGTIKLLQTHDGPTFPGSVVVTVTPVKS